MKKKLLFIALLTSSLLFSQIQIGSDINAASSGDQFGTSVSLSSDGSIVAIGGTYNDGNSVNSGHVRIYRNNNGAWEQVGSDIKGNTSFEFFGKSVSLSSDGSIVAIGSPGSGRVCLYKNNNGIWEQIGSDINGVTSDDQFGLSVSLSSDGSIVAIGSPNNDGNGADSGHVRVYKNNNGIWEQIGSDINGVASGDQFGINVSLSSDGSIVAIAGSDNDGNSINSGHVRVYKNNNGTWTQIGSNINTELAGDFSKSNKGVSSLSLSSNGNIIAIGNVHYNSGFTHLDYVSIYKNNNGIWEQIGSNINGEATGDQFGRSVSLSSDGDIVAIGGPWNIPLNSIIHGGHVRIYKNMSGTWTQIGSDIDGKVTNNLFGASVSLSSDGSIVAIGGPDNNGFDQHIGHVRVFNLSSVLSINKFIEFNSKLYPNPVKNAFTIQLKEDLDFKKVNIYNSLGQYIKSSKELIISTLNFTKGIYIVEIETNKGKAIKKLIIE